jgi:hypothetical protein
VKRGRKILVPATNSATSRDGSVGIATGSMAGVLFSAVQEFSLHYSVETGSGAHPASCAMGTGCPFSGGKAEGA